MSMVCLFSLRYGFVLVGMILLEIQGFQVTQVSQVTKASQVPQVAKASQVSQVAKASQVSRMCR